VRLEQLLMTNGYSKEDMIIVSIPTADQVSVVVSSASLMAESNQEASRKASIAEGPLRKISTSSIEKKVSFDRGVSIQEEEIKLEAIDGQQQQAVNDEEDVEQL